MSEPEKKTRDSPLKLAPSKGLQVSAERRPITVMFGDLVGSTGLAAKLNPEDWRNLANAYLDEASAAVTRLGGHFLKNFGNGLMALFGYSQAQENDAELSVPADDGRLFSSDRTVSHAGSKLKGIKQPI